MNKFLEQFKDYDGVANALDRSIDIYDKLYADTPSPFGSPPELYEAYKNANESERDYLDKINFLEGIGYDRYKARKKEIACHNSILFYDYYFAMYVFEKANLIEKYRALSERLLHTEAIYKQTVDYLHTDIAAGAKERVEIIFKN